HRLPEMCDRIGLLPLLIAQTLNVAGVEAAERIHDRAAIAIGDNRRGDRGESCEKVADHGHPFLPCLRGRCRALSSARRRGEHKHSCAQDRSPLRLATSWRATSPVNGGGNTMAALEIFLALHLVQARDG